MVIYGKPLTLEVGNETRRPTSCLISTSVEHYTKVPSQSNKVIFKKGINV